MCWDSLGSRNTPIRYENTALKRKLNVFSSTLETELVFLRSLCMHILNHQKLEEVIFEEVQKCLSKFY